MIIGKRTPQRIEQYLKYNTSKIFDNTNNSIPSSNLSQPKNRSSHLTPKPNENRSPQQEFIPKYDNLTSLQRYNKHFYKEEPSKCNSSRNQRRTFLDIKPPNTKEDNDQSYTSRQRYMKHLFGEEHLIEEDANNKKKKNQRSKSLFQRSDFELNIENENDLCKAIRDLSNCSDIFHTKTNSSHIISLKSISNRKNCNKDKNDSISIDELIHPNRTSKTQIKPLNLKDIKLKAIVPVYNTDRQDQMKHMFPTDFNWVNNNTELSSKSHIYRSKNNINNENSTHHKAPSLNYVLSTQEVTKDYYNKYPKKQIEDNEIQMFEMKGPKKFLENLEDKTIKKLFLEKGIHIYNFENKSVFTDRDDKITFQIRNNENEKEFQNKLKRIRNEINSYGVDFKRVYVNTSKYPRKRRATPGNMLKQEKRQVKEKLRSFVPQYDVDYKPVKPVFHPIK